MQLPRQLHCYLLNLNDRRSLPQFLFADSLGILNVKRESIPLFLNKQPHSSDTLKKKKKTLKALPLIFSISFYS